MTSNWTTQTIDSLETQLRLLRIEHLYNQQFLQTLLEINDWVFQEDKEWDLKFA